MVSALGAGCSPTKPPWGDPWTPAVCGARASAERGRHSEARRARGRDVPLSRRAATLAHRLHVSPRPPPRPTVRDTRRDRGSRVRWVYQRTGRITASAITHALVDATWGALLGGKRDGASAPSRHRLPPTSYRGAGDADAIIRASPFGEMDSHCQPTIKRTGSLSEGVEQESTTSLPTGPAFPGAAVNVGTHVHSRPSTSVTVRLAIVASGRSCIWTTDVFAMLLARQHRSIGCWVRRLRT
jgi:hypothetical protein